MGLAILRGTRRQAPCPPASRSATTSAGIPNAGHVSGRITRVHTRDFDWKGYRHRAGPDNPQYEIQSDKTDHVAVHKGSALRHVSE